MLCTGVATDQTASGEDFELGGVAVAKIDQRTPCPPTDLLS